MAKCLSFHAAYQCQRSGACCSAGWTIPFDRGEWQVVEALGLGGGRVEPKEDGVAAVLHRGRCAFLEGTNGIHACEIHRIGGHASLPLTCRMFPRIVLHDSRGTFISLSHFCPTAAAMLFVDGPPAAIVDAPEALAGAEALDGLNARDVWPPLLRQGVMMEVESYGMWERLSVEVLTREGIAPRDALKALDAATARIIRWTPESSVPLMHAVRDAFATLAPPTAVLGSQDMAIKRWLAARLFGTWIAYQGSGLATIVRYLRACLDTFDVELARDRRRPLEAIRRSDHLLVHESSSQQLANLLNERS